MPQPLRRQLNGRQRVFDLVGQASRHFAPGRVPLPLQQRGNVVENDDVDQGLFPGRDNRGSPAYKHLPAACAEQYNLLVPDRLPLIDVGLEYVMELFQVLVAGADPAERTAGNFADIEAEDPAAADVDGAQAFFRVQDEHPGGQPFQHRLQVLMLDFRFILAEPGRVPGAGYPAGHVVERGDQETQFIIARDPQPGMVIAFRHGFGPFRQVAYRRDQLPGGVKRGPYRGKHAEQEDHGQDQDKTQLQLFPQVRQFLVLHEGRLDALRQVVYPFGYGV